jgi:hypothetical protein
MKTFLLISIALLALSNNLLFAQTSGGPDNYGYTWRNQSDTGFVNVPAPKYNWKEIKGKGTKILGLGDDNRIGPFNMNWNFFSRYNA